MTTQPEALRLAERLDLYSTGDEHQRDVEQASAELRRLHEVNAELVDGLEAVKDIGQQSLQLIYESRQHANKARAAIAKATGSNND